MPLAKIEVLGQSRCMPLRVQIRSVVPEDAETWLRLRTAHWLHGAEEHGAEIAAFFAGTLAEPQAVFLAECEGQAVAVVELSIRRDLPMLPNVKVGHVGGFYIVPEFRGGGLATAFALRTRQGPPTSLPRLRIRPSRPHHPRSPLPPQLVSGCI